MFIVQRARIDTDTIKLPHQQTFGPETPNTKYAELLPSSFVFSLGYLMVSKRALTPKHPQPGNEEDVGNRSLWRD
jgi:hypothetical protein